MLPLDGPTDASTPTADGRPTMARRSLLVGAGLGVTAMSLPSSVAAASGPSFEPAAFDYGAGDELVAAWLPFNAGTADYSGSGVAADAALSDLTGNLTQGGTTASQLNLNVGDPEISGQNIAVADWNVRNSSGSIDTSTSPHLEFSISVGAGALSLGTLVLHAIRNMDGTGASINLAAYVSTDGFATSTLRRTATLAAGSSFRHVVINLGLAGQTFTTGTVSVRLFPFLTTPSRPLRLNAFNSSPTPVALTSADTIDAARVNTQIGATGPNWIAGFVGSHLAG